MRPLRQKSSRFLSRGALEASPVLERGQRPLCVDRHGPQPNQRAHVKYGFPGEEKGTIMVTLKRLPGELRLTVADDGQGLDPRRADSEVGGRLVDAFAEKLGGQVERKSDSRGTSVHLILPSCEGS
jgi:hypothetical protein